MGGKLFQEINPIDIVKALNMGGKLFQEINPIDIVKALNMFDDEAIKKTNKLLAERNIDLRITSVK